MQHPWYGPGARSFAAAVSLGISSVAAGQVLDFDIPTQEAVRAIPEFARQAGIQIIAPASGLEDVYTPELRGSLELRDALRVLLQGTDLEIASDDGSVITLRRRASGEVRTIRTNAAPVTAQLREPEVAAEVTEEVQREPEPAPAEPVPRARAVETMTVTGTRIRGTQPSSPVVTITAEEMRLAGHANLGEVVRAMPQNFDGGQNPGVTQGATGGGLSNQNVTGASSLNLRGLGPDATVTLLNGARLPYDGFFQATDVAVVPLAAIDRVEVLLDGASAIYGADAVGGVANVILRRDFEGAEVSARYGTATSGGYTQNQYTAVAGTLWRSGGVLAAGEISRSDPIFARHRDYLSYMPNQDVRIYPEIKQDGVLFSAFQEFGTSVELTLDAFYTERRMHAFDQQTPLTFTDISKSTIWGVSPALHFDLPGDWLLRTHGFYGINEADSDFTLIFIPTGEALSESVTCYCNEAQSIGIEFEGPLGELRGGQVRLSTGAGYRENEFAMKNPVSGTIFIEGTRRSHYGFAELNLPLVSAEQGVRGVTQLSFNGAVRYEDYGSNDFGSVTTPKAGLLWGITPAVDVRVSWGKSFKTPTLVRQNQLLNIALSPASLFGVNEPEDATVLRTLGGNPDLGPERAEIFTAGLVLRPEAVPDLRMEISGFHINYKDRVDTPITPFTAALSDPTFAEFVIRDPTQAQQEAAIAMASQFFGTGYDPDNVIAIIFNHHVNVARQKAKGIDLSADYAFDVGRGRMTATGTASWLDSERRLTSLSPPLDTSGVIYFPAGFRARGGLSWAVDRLTLAGYLNYIDGVKNTNLVPPVHGSSMTTVDAALHYRADLQRIGGLRLSLAVSNAFNRRPPFLEPAQDYLVNYDSTNYSAIGRVVSATVTMEF
jgi:iron complex outermembrane recepter protein